MCLKGLQFSINPADYLTIEQLKSSMLQSQYEELKEWAISPSQISQQTITKFLEAVRDGLMNEGHHLPVHQLHYIEWRSIQSMSSSEFLTGKSKNITKGTDNSYGESFFLRNFIYQG